MGWIKIPAEYSKSGKTKKHNSQLECSKCGARYSEHYLRLIGSQITGDGKPPQYCPHCGFKHTCFIIV